MKKLRSTWLAVLLCAVLPACYAKDTITELRPSITAAAKENKIDPIMLEAIIRHESANGKSKLARTRNNLAGIKGKNGRYRAFSSKRECVAYVARLLYKYKMSGRTTLDKINKRYAPNNPQWASKVRWHIRHIQKHII